MPSALGWILRADWLASMVIQPPPNPSKLDCDTPLGREAIVGESRVMARVARFTETLCLKSNSKTSDLDCVFADLSHVLAVAEIKTRNMDKKQLEDFGTYMISNSKIDAGLIASGYLGAKFLLCVGLHDGVVMWDVNKDLVYDVEQRETQATVNGGTKIDEVALIPVKDATWIPWD